jgi:hypothetical protein
VHFKHLDHGENPFDRVDAHDWEVHGTGRFANYQFIGGGDDYGRKALGDPDMVAVSWVHEFGPPGNVVSLVYAMD